MFSSRLFLTTGIFLVLVLGGGIAAWHFVRAPETISADTVCDDVQLAGRTQELVLQVIGLSRQVSAMQQDAATGDIPRLRAQALQLLDASRRLGSELESRTMHWVPVAEFADLNTQCGRLCQLILDKTEPAEVVVAASPGAMDAAPATADTSIDHPASDALEASDTAGNAIATTDTATGDTTTTNGNAATEDANDSDSTAQVLASSPDELVELFELRARQLLELSQTLQLRTVQAVETAMFARGSLFGFTSSDILLALLTLAILVSLGRLWQAWRRLKVSPDRLIEMELMLIGQTDRPTALRRCHERVQGLLELADGFCRESSD